MTGRVAVGIRFTLRRLVRGVAAHPVTALSALGVMALTLLVGGAFALALVNARAVVERVGDQLTVSAWLEPEVDRERAAALAGRAARIDGVLAVEALGADETLARLTAGQEDAEEWVEALAASPLPPTLEVSLLPGRRTGSDLERVRAELVALPGVESVLGGEDWLAGYRRLVGWIRALGLGVGGVLGMATLVIVASTTRLALATRRDELEILSLVGAGRLSLHLPFVLEGLLLGLVAAGLALALLALAHLALAPGVGAVLASLAPEAAPRFFDGLQAAVLLACGALLGGLGALLSLAGGLRA